MSGIAMPALEVWHKQRRSATAVPADRPARLTTQPMLEYGQQYAARMARD